MKISLNIEKKHLIFLCIFLVLVGGVFAIAGTDWDPSNPHHETLYINNIKAKNDIPEGDPRIYIHNDLRIGGSNEGNYWTLGIKGPTILDGDLRIDENLCDKNNRCISVEDIISKIEEIGGVINGGGRECKGTPSRVSCSGIREEICENINGCYWDDSGNYVNCEGTVAPCNTQREEICESIAGCNFRGEERKIEETFTDPILIVGRYNTGIRYEYADDYCKYKEYTNADSETIETKDCALGGRVSYYLNNHGWRTEHCGDNRANYGVLKKVTCYKIVYG